ncbi:MAG: helix-turn-helix transcriptional regulator [Leptolyngbyaceae cyanobacterium SM2_5_2]|nr:helix-turn-helix transcriptional regulator [Leptolyngbyaceae cyanobacterium SM2_5_2]
MAITLSHTDYLNWLNDSATSVCTDDGAEWVYVYPSTFGQGQQRSIELRDGVELMIEEVCLHEDMKVNQRDLPHPLEYTFELVENGNRRHQHYTLYGSGLAPAGLWYLPGQRRVVSVNVHIEPARFQQWIGAVTHAEAALLDLLRPLDQPYLERSGTPTAAMQMAVQAILSSPFQGLTQRLYLESKVWELMALLIEDLRTTPAQAGPPALKPDDVERIHYASKLLRRQMTHPPSLLELARAVGINDHKLKVGFRQVFGTTVFGYLHEHRMERSRQLLESGDISVIEAAQAVGFTSRGHFAAAFRRRYGVNPGVYVRGRRA